MLIGTRFVSLGLAPTPNEGRLGELVFEEEPAVPLLGEFDFDSSVKPKFSLGQALAD